MIFLQTVDIFLEHVTLHTSKNLILDAKNYFKENESLVRYLKKQHKMKKY